MMQWRSRLTKQKTTSYEVIVPIHGPVVTADTVVGALKEHIGKSRPIIFHLDIAPNVRFSQYSHYCYYVVV